MGNKGSNTATTTTSANPAAMGAYYDVLSRATQAANKPYQGYGGEWVAPINQQQRQGFGSINEAADFWQPYVAQGGQDIAGAAAPTTDVSQYMSPYTQQVIDATQRQFETDNARQQSQVVGNAAAQGALGGNRVGVAQALTAEAQNRAQAPVIAGLYNTGYQNAQQAAMADKARQLQAGVAGGQLGVAGSQAGLAAGQAQVGAGGVEWNQQQLQNQKMQEEFFRNQGYDFQTAQWLASIATGVGSQMGGTSETEGPTPNPWMQALGLGLSAASMFSDPDLKEGIEEVGRLKDGQKVYRFRYKGSPQTHIGLMSDEVEEAHPEAVSKVQGVGMVDYDLATRDAAKRALGGEAPMSPLSSTGYVPLDIKLTPGKGAPEPPKLPEQQGLDTKSMGQGLGVGAKKLHDWANSPGAPLNLSAPSPGPSDGIGGVDIRGNLGGLYAAGGGCLDPVGPGQQPIDQAPQQASQTSMPPAEFGAALQGFKQVSAKPEGLQSWPGKMGASGINFNPNSTSEAPAGLDQPWWMRPKGSGIFGMADGGEVDLPISVGLSGNSFQDRFSPIDEIEPDYSRPGVMDFRRSLLDAGYNSPARTEPMVEPEVPEVREPPGFRPFSGVQTAETPFVRPAGERSGLGYAADTPDVDVNPVDDPVGRASLRGVGRGNSIIVAPAVGRRIAATPIVGVASSGEGMGGFNPLGISDEARQGLIAMGLSMMANPRGGKGSLLSGIGEGGQRGLAQYAASRAATAAAQRQALLDRQKAATEARKEAFEREKFNRPYREMTAAEKARIDKEKVPTGMQYVDGKLVPLPGYIEATEQIEKVKRPPRSLSVNDITKLSEEGGKFADVSRFKDTFKDDYAGYGAEAIGRAAMAIGRNAPGMVPENVKQAAQWWQGYDRFKNVVRNDLFGSALTATEKAAFERSDVNPGMDKETIRANLNMQQMIARNGIKRKAKALITAGYDPAAVLSSYGISNLEELDRTDDIATASKPVPTDADRARAKSSPESRERFIKHFGVEP